MKSRKKVTLMLMLCLTCFLFTGCSHPIKDLQKAWSEAQDANADKKGEKETIDLLQSIQGYNTSSKTTKAANKLANAQNAYSGAKAELKSTKSHWYDLWGFTPTKHNLAVKKTNEAKATLAQSKTAYKTAVATDKILAKDKKAREKATQQQNSGIMQKVLIGAGIVIALIILLLLFKKLKKKPVEKQEEPKPEEEEVKEHTGLLEVNYDSLLKDNCDKCDLNAAEISNMFDGNTRLASDAVQYCVTKGIKGDEAMEYVKKKAQHFKDYGN